MFKLTRYEMPAILIVACFFLPFFYMPPFVDDVARYSYGYIGLASQGRFLTELYYILLNSSGKLISPDVYQLNLVVSFVIMIVACNYFAESVFGKQWIAKTITICVLICSPFYIENMSYHIDVIGMSASFSLAMLAAVRYEHKFNFIFRLLLLTAASFFYQTSFAVFVCLVILQSLNNLLNSKTQKENMRYVLSSVVIFVVTFAIVQTTTTLLSTDVYVDNHTTIVHLNRDGISEFLSNINYIFSLLTSLSTTQLAVVSVLVVISYAVCLWQAVKSFTSGRYLDSLLFAVSLPISFLLLFIPYAMFSNAIISSRVLMSFPAFLMVALTPLLKIKDSKVRYAVYLITAFYLFISVAMASIYVNAFKYEPEYKIRKLESVIASIDSMDKRSGLVKIDIRNEPNLPHYLKQIYLDYPILKNIVKFNLTSKWFMNAYFWYSGMNAEIAKSDGKNVELIEDGRNYKLQKDSGIYIVTFK